MLINANLGFGEDSTGRLYARGKISWFGGPHDSGVKPDEGLALYTAKEAGADDFNKIFLPRLDSGLGLARQLNPMAFYCAMRWDYRETPRAVIRRAMVRVESGAGVVVWCAPADWGPNIDTERVIDVSEGAMQALKIGTDSVVTATVFMRGPFC